MGKISEHGTFVLCMSYDTLTFGNAMTKKQNEHTSIIWNDDVFVIMRDNVTSERYKMHASWEIISAITYFVWLYNYK